MRLIAVFLSIFATLCANAASFSVIDDFGHEVRLDGKPEKIVSLAPHLTELLFSLGAGDRIVATVRHSDYPDAATRIPRLGDAFSLSVEAIVDVDPDLILAWSTGGNQRTLQQLRQLGYPIYLNEASVLDQIATTVERIGRLVGETGVGKAHGEDFRNTLAGLAEKNNALEPVRVFFQISDNQLYTINNDHLIGQAITTCGAENVFGELGLPVPMVSLESVLDANPDVILVASPYEGFETRWSHEWTRLGWQGRIRYLNASLITRPGLRMLDGIKIMCKQLRK